MSLIPLTACFFRRTQDRISPRAHISKIVARANPKKRALGLGKRAQVSPQGVAVVRLFWPASLAASLISFIDAEDGVNPHARWGSAEIFYFPGPINPTTDGGGRSGGTGRL